MSASATSSSSLKYRFIEEDSWGWRPAIAIAPQINLPSGSEARGLGAGRITGFIPIWASKDYQPVDRVRRRRPQHQYRPRPEELVVLGRRGAARADPNWTVGGEAVLQLAGRDRREDTRWVSISAVIYNINDIYHVLFSAGRNLINARDTNQFSTYIGMQFTF